MPPTMGEKIRLLLKRRDLTLAELAEITGQSRQNLSNKLNRDNFSEKEMIEIAEALNCTYRNEIIMNDTGEVI